MDFNDKLHFFLLPAVPPTFVCGVSVSNELNKQVGPAWSVEHGRFVFLLTSAIIALLFAVAYSVSQHNTDLVLYSIVNWAMVGFFCLLLAYIAIVRNMAVASVVMAVVVGAFFLLLLASGGVGGTGIIWGLVLPPCFYYLLGLRHGNVAVVVYAGASVAVFFLPGVFSAWSVYPLGLKARFLCAYLLSTIAGLSYALEQVAVQRQLRLEIERRADMQRQLSRAKESAERLNEITPSAIYTVDRNGYVTSFNRAAEELTGYRTAEVLLRPCSVWIEAPGGCQATSPQAMRNVKATVLRKDQSHITVLRNMQPLLNEKSELQGAIASFIDVSVQERSNSELVIARDQAQAANRTKSAFLANMSHEIRTPMNGVLGMSSLLLETQLGREQRDYAEAIQTSAESLLTLINDILDFSKIESGKMEIEQISFDLRTTVESAMELLAYKAAEKGLELVTLVDAAVPTTLVGDPGRIRQVLVNLVGNAVKFTESGDVVVRVRLDSSRLDRMVLGFEVRDTGIGIAPESLDKLFGSFSQLDASVTRRYGGTGLGLAISRRLCELMGGGIDVKSIAGQGSTFSFNVVCRPSDSQIHQYRREQLSTCSILVVENNESARSALCHYLTSWGCVCECVGDAGEALALLSSQDSCARPFDVAIVSQQLSGMSGVQLAGLINKNGAQKAPKVVVATLVGKRGDAAQMKQAGVSGYLTKPLKYRELAECLQLVLSGTNAVGDNVADGGARLVTRHTIAEANSRSRGRILLAEDNPVNQKVASRILEKAGYHCDIAADGIQAVQAQTQRQYRVILMDCQMPVLSGYDATRAIREEESTMGLPRVPIIAMTANAMQGDREKCISAGMDDYLSKPINSRELIELIRKWYTDLKESADE